MEILDIQYGKNRLVQRIQSTSRGTRTVLCVARKNSEQIPFLMKKTVTQIHLETDVKIKNELPIVVGLSQVLPKSRASQFGLFGRYWMLFILSMDNNRFVH